MDVVDPLALPFDQYQRYTAITQVADLIRPRLARARLRVLDVGGYFHTRLGFGILPSTHFLSGDQVFAVDLVAEKLPGYSLATGLALPFGDAAFDLVVNCDTLEHVPPAGRPGLVDELLRVAGHFLVLVAPFDSESTRLAERILDEYLSAQGMQQPQLQEHVEHGLPDADALRSSLAGRGLAFVDFADGYLHHWLAMMLIKHTPGQSLGFQLDLDRYYNRHFSPGDRREPAYRRVFVIAQPGNEAILPAIASRLCPPDESSVAGGPDLILEVVRALAQSQAAALIERPLATEGQLVEVRSRVAALEAQNTQLRHVIAGYEQGRFIRFMRGLHDLRTRLRSRLYGRSRPSSSS